MKDFRFVFAPIDVTFRAASIGTTLGGRVDKKSTIFFFFEKSVNLTFEKSEKKRFLKILGILTKTSIFGNIFL